MNSVKALLPCYLLLMLASLSPGKAPRPQPVQSETKPGDLLTARPLNANPKADELRELLRARYNEALGEVQVAFKLYQFSRIEFDTLAGAEQRLVRAALELFDTPADRIAFLTQFVELNKQAEVVSQTRVAIGVVNRLEPHVARYMRLDAEIQLLRAKREAAKGKGR